MSAAPRKGAKALPVDKMGKNQIKDLTAHVAKSTASIGKFNAPVPGDEKIKTRGKRRQFDSVTDTGAERGKAMGFIDTLVRREKDFEMDVNVAARKIQRAKEAETRAAKKAKLADKAEGGGKGAGKRGNRPWGSRARRAPTKNGEKVSDDQIRTVEGWRGSAAGVASRAREKQTHAQPRRFTFATRLVSPRAREQPP